MRASCNTPTVITSTFRTSDYNSMHVNSICFILLALWQQGTVDSFQIAWPHCVIARQAFVLSQFTFNRPPPDRVAVKLCAQRSNTVAGKRLQNGEYLPLIFIHFVPQFLSILYSVWNAIAGWMAAVLPFRHERETCSSFWLPYFCTDTRTHSTSWSKGTVICLRNAVKSMRMQAIFSTFVRVVSIACTSFFSYIPLHLHVQAYSSWQQQLGYNNNNGNQITAYFAVVFVRIDNSICLLFMHTLSMHLGRSPSPYSLRNTLIRSEHSQFVHNSDLRVQSQSNPYAFAVVSIQCFLVFLSLCVFLFLFSSEAREYVFAVDRNHRHSSHRGTHTC